VGFDDGYFLLDIPKMITLRIVQNIKTITASLERVCKNPINEVNGKAMMGIQSTTFHPLVK
jgi:hypothetical protein